MNGEMNEKMQSNKEQEAFQNGEVDDLSDFVNGLRGNIDVFVNRIRSNQARGRSLLNDSSIQALFMNLTAQHSQLLKHLQALDDKRGKVGRCNRKCRKMIVTRKVWLYDSLKFRICRLKNDSRICFRSFRKSTR